MKKMQTLLAAACAATLVFAAGSALAVTASNTNVTLGATIAPKAQLTIPAVAVTFNDGALGDPGAAPSIAGCAPAVVSAKIRTAGSSGLLTVTAALDFSDGGINPIAILNVSPAAFGDLAAVANMPVTPATATLFSNKGSGTYGGSMAFSLANSWSYVPATYNAVTLTYTLTAP